MPFTLLFDETPGTAMAPASGGGPASALACGVRVLRQAVLVMRKCVRSLVETSSAIRVVGEACNGMVAVRLAQQLHPHLVLMDVHMPGLNGVEATRQIKTLVPRSTIIGLTAQQEAGTELAMLSAGADRLLAKEDMVEGLPPVIERAISQRVSGRCKPTR